MTAASPSQKPETPEIQAGARLLLAFARERPDIVRRQAIDRLANRRGWDRPSAGRALEHALESELLHEAQVAQVGIRASTRRVLRPGAAPNGEASAELAAAELDCLLTRADVSERWLAEALTARGRNTSQPSVNAWRRGQRRIPLAHQPSVRELLRSRARERLQGLRTRAGLSQATLAAMFERTDKAISFWERRADCVPEDQWERLLQVLTEIPASPQEDTGPAIDRAELDRILAATQLPKKVLARTLGIAACQVQDWTKGRRPIPARYWRQIAELEHAETPAPAPVDPIRDRVLPDLEQLVTDADPPGVTQTRARRDLPYGHESLWRAVKLGVTEGRFHRRRIRSEVTPGRMRSVIGLFPGPEPADLPEHERESATPAVCMLPAAVKLISESPGIDVKQLRAELGVEPKLARAVAALAVEKGHACWRDLDYTDSRGRPRGARQPRRVLYPVPAA